MNDVLIVIEDSDGRGITQVAHDDLSRIGAVLVLSSLPTQVHIVKMMQVEMPRMRERFEADEHWRRSGKRRGRRIK